MRKRGFLLLAPMLLGGGWFALGGGAERAPRSHVTIYVAPSLAESGGALIVTGMPVSEAEWRAIPLGDNPAMLDPTNPKRAQVATIDRHFGAVATASVTVVEFRYPVGGTYTFNILPVPGSPPAPGLKTQLVSVGSSEMTDPETDGTVAWPSTSVIAIPGPGRDAGWTRMADSTFSNAFHEDEPVVIRHYEGVRTIELTEDQVRRHVVPPRG